MINSNTYESYEQQDNSYSQDGIQTIFWITCFGVFILIIFAVKSDQSNNSSISNSNSSSYYNHNTQQESLKESLKESLIQDQNKFDLSDKGRSYDFKYKIKDIKCDEDTMIKAIGVIAYLSKNSGYTLESKFIEFLRNNSNNFSINIDTLLFNLLTNCLNQNTDTLWHENKLCNTSKNNLISAISNMIENNIKITKNIKDLQTSLRKNNSLKNTLNNKNSSSNNKATKHELAKLLEH